MKIQICIVILLNIILVALFSGCAVMSEKHTHQGIEHEMLYDFCNDHNIILLNVEPVENTSIIAYKKENEYGIMKLFLSEQPNTISFIKNSVSIDDNSHQIAFLQLDCAERNYIALFLLNKEIAQNASVITIEFEDKINPYKISVTTRDKDSVIIPYSSENDLRNISGVTIENISGSVIYETGGETEG
ncbi:MAG: hypothetical protein HPY74_15880 [Firmicutes bacterium]|nr:hypothetical protein [Bacillota bacterium]